MTALDTTVLEQRLNGPTRKPSFRIFFITAGLMFGALGGQVVFSGMSEGYCLVWPGIGTAFAPGFSHRGFARIKPGMTTTEVAALIGEPLGQTYGRGSPAGWATFRAGDVTWGYSHDSSKLGGDWAWLAREVVFRDGRVTQTVRWTYYD